MQASQILKLILLSVYGIAAILTCVLFAIPQIASAFPEVEPTVAILIFFIPAILLIVIEHIIIQIFKIIQELRKRDVNSKISNLEKRISDLENQVS